MTNTADISALCDCNPCSESPRGRSWRRRILSVIGPLGASILVHAVLIGALGLTTFMMVQAERPVFGDVEFFITPAVDSQSDFVFADQRALTIEPLALPMLEDWNRLIPDFDADVKNASISGELNDATAGLESLGSLSVIGTGGGAAEAGAGGWGGGQRIGGRREWAPLDARVERTSYVIDFSGSIIMIRDDLLHDLKLSIGRMKLKQSFNVHVFHGQGNRVVTDSFRDGLVAATPETKRAFFAWIDKIAPAGATEPRQALNRALAEHPQELVFLSDGYFDERIVEAFTRRNHLGGRRAVRVRSLVCDESLIGPNRLAARQTEGAQRLARLAERNGGSTIIITGFGRQERP